MHETAPIWLEYVKAFGTIGVAVVAACIAGAIAHRQWRTAHAKLILDLFDRRFDLYTELNAAVADVQRLGSENVSFEMRMRFARARDRAKFLFGPEVVVILDPVYQDLALISRTERRLKHLAEEDLRPATDLQYAAFDRLDGFFGTLEKVVAPYMIMDQKLSRKRV